MQRFLSYQESGAEIEFGVWSFEFGDILVFSVAALIVPY